MSSENKKDDEPAQASEKNTKCIIINKSTKHNPLQFPDFSRKLLCIEYPGMVDNVDNMIATLGGMNTIEMAVGNYNRRLELRFRCDDIFSKPCWGDKDFNSGLLVKITARQPKIKPEQASSSKKQETDLTTYHYQVVGVTTMTFRFSRLCDFQYLPLVSTKKRENADTECRYIYDDIIPPSLPDIKWFLSNESVSMPFFFPPPIFAKFNTSKENKLFYERYKYYEKVIPQVAERLKKDSQKKQQELKNIIDRSRSTRRQYSVFVNFNVKDVVIPTGPTEQALTAIKKRGLEHGSVEKIAQLFRERPIWSKSAVLHISGVRRDRLKVILPGLAYYIPNGPWRVMWCRFGYDPRLDPSCRIYQTFDFRVRASDGLKVKVQAKRSYSSNLMHYRAGPPTTDKFSLKNCSAQQKSKPKPCMDESLYLLKPNMIPPARQMFYQYCDLHLPEIEGMLARLPAVTKDTRYHFKNGWLPNGFNDQCREIVNKYVMVEVQKLLMEEKKKKDEEMDALALQRTIIDQTVVEPQSFQQESFPTIISAPIVIDSDDDDDVTIGKNEEAMDIDEVYGGLGVEDDEMTDTDDEDPRKEDDDEDSIDLEAVNEINKIIGNINEPEMQLQEGDEEKEDSEDEFDPELVSLYQKLIVSNTDTEKKFS